MTWDSHHIHQYQQSDQTLRVQGRGGRKLPWRRLWQSAQVRDIITNEQVFSLLLITNQTQPAMTITITNTQRGSRAVRGRWKNLELCGCAQVYEDNMNLVMLALVMKMKCHMTIPPSSSSSQLQI